MYVMKWLYIAIMLRYKICNWQFSHRLKGQKLISYYYLLMCTMTLDIIHMTALHVEELGFSGFHFHIEIIKLISNIGYRYYPWNAPLL